MPTRKYREGDELKAWEARKKRHQERMELARQRAKDLSVHTLVLLPDAAAMLGNITVKSLREAEGRARERGEYWPRRITLTQRLTGYRLADLEDFLKSREEGATEPGPPLLREGADA